MKRQKGRVLVVSVLAAGMAMAATVTVNPPAGTETNAFAVVSGGDALAVNPGETGGTVRLNPSNTHTGGTTLGSGTLVVSQPVKAGSQIGELGAGPFVQNGGTLRYAGPAGGVWTRAMTNTASSATGAVVWQIDNDLTMDCDVAQTAGAFVKTGPGTLTFTQPFNFGETTAVDTDTRRKMMDLSPDRAPTQGYSNGTVVDGAVVIDTQPDDLTNFTVPVTNVLTAAGPSGFLTVGVCTTTNGTETTGILEHRSGVTRTGGNMNIGFCNGSTHNSETPLSPTIRVTGGRLLVGPAGASAVYVGVNQNVAEFTGQRSAPVIDISNANVEAPSAAYNLVCKGLYLAHTPGAHTTLRVHDGGHLRAMDAHVYTGDYATETDPIPTTNLVEVTGEGSWMSFQHFYNDHKNNGMVTTFRIADGGTVEMRNFVNSKTGKLHLVVDGGVWRHRNNDNTTPHIPSSVTSVKVGPGGFYTFFNNGKETHPVIFEKGIEPLDDSGTDGGLHVTQGSSAMPPLRLNAANTYCGPTEISFTRVYLGKKGKLPETTDLSVYTSSGGLIITNGITQKVRSFTFGRDGTTDSPFLGFGPKACLEVTGELHVGARTSAPKFHLFEKQGGTNALVKAGTYTFITAREEDFADLARLSGCATFPLKPDTVDYFCTADVADGRARLRVTVSPAGSTPAAASGDPLVLNNTVLAETLTATAEQLAAAHTVYTNPGYPENKHGPVELGALTGFAAGGKLIAGAGTIYASDLSFANSAADIVLKFGTLAYTGGDATIPGVTIDTSGNRSSVLSITNANTTLTLAEMNVVTGGFTKLGPGTLKLKPPAGTTLVLPNSVVNNGNYNGVTAYGDGPSSGSRAVNLNGGWTEIGTVGDPSDAPDVYGPYDFSVGSQSHRNGIAEQTAGSLRLNNGSLYINSLLYISYYCGNYASNPDLILTPTVEQNGGFLSCSIFRLAQCADSNQQTASPRYFLHGGTNVVRDALHAGYSAVAKGHTYRATVSVDGGLLVVSNDFICGCNANSIGADVSITGNGRVEVGGIFYPAYANTRDTNTFLLAGNGVLRGGSINGNNVNYPLVATFDGGTYESVLPASGNTLIYKMQKAYIGAGGLNIDLSQHAEQEVRNNWLVVQQTFDHDPDCEGTDGGIAIWGRGTVALSTGLADSTFNGPIRVTGGARVCPVNRHVAPLPLQVTPGCILHDYAGACMVKDLTLGEAGATTPVSIEQLAGGATLGFVVTNNLQILSPVTFTTIQEAHDFQPALASGVYTALVYNAACSDVDLALFGLTSADATRATLTAAHTTIVGGEFDGMKAVVLTVAAKNNEGISNGNVWKSDTLGGAWSAGANWENPDFIPNGKGQSVCFNPAKAAGVGVTLDAPVTLGDITFNANSPAYGYTLSGSALTLEAANLYSTPTVLNASGTNTISSQVVLSDGADLCTDEGNELRITGGVTGAGTLNVNTHVTTGAGRIDLSVAPTFTGSVKTGSGRVAMDDFSFIQTASQLTLGPGTLLYTGPNVEIPGLTLSSGASRCAVFDHDSDVTLSALAISGTSAFLKRGAGTLRLHGTETFSPNTKVNHNGDTFKTLGIVKPNGDSPTVTMRGVTMAKGTIIQGEENDPANAPTVDLAANELAIGSWTLQGDATYILNNGTLTGTASVYLGYYANNSLSPVPTLTYIQNGGTMSANNLNCGYTNNKWANTTDVYIEINGGSVVLSGNLNMGRDKAKTPASQTCRFVMNGGSFEVGANLHLAYKANAPQGFADLNGGVVTVKGSIYPAYGGTAESTLRLNEGAMLRCNGVNVPAAGATTRFYGNGGTFRPLCLTTAGSTMADGSFTYLYASTNGLVVDTSETLDGAAYTIAQPVLHDPDCESTDGGLVKRGLGLLTLTGANTYTGGTVVEGGVLALSGAGTLGTGSSLSVANGAVCDLGGVARTVADATASGIVQNGGLSVTGDLFVGEGLLSMVGDLTLGNELTVDFAGRQGLDLDAGEPVAVVTGTPTLPNNSVTATNAGNVTKVRIVRYGDVVYAVNAPSGTVLVFR